VFRNATTLVGFLLTSSVVQRKDGGTAEKRDIGVFDDTMEATLTLWGSTTASANTWDISKTSKKRTYFSHPS
jgi:hypothetical protein